MADAIRKYSTSYKVRFAWWVAEEWGLVGSKHYPNNGSPQEKDSIIAYLNFDMVSRGYFGVFGGDGSAYGVAAPPGSEVIQYLLSAISHPKNIPVTTATFTNGSGYVFFWPAVFLEQFNSA
jgi:Zn-dependent M28 family amino/carboxypeptidase